MNWKNSKQYRSRLRRLCFHQNDADLFGSGSATLLKKVSINRNKFTKQIEEEPRKFAVLLTQVPALPMGSPLANYERYEYSRK
jgi:hypothetical protein